MIVVVVVVMSLFEVDTQLAMGFLRAPAHVVACTMEVELVLSLW